MKPVQASNPVPHLPHKRRRDRRDALSSGCHVKTNEMLPTCCDTSQLSSMTHPEEEVVVGTEHSKPSTVGAVLGYRREELEKTELMWRLNAEHQV